MEISDTQTINPKGLHHTERDREGSIFVLLTVLQSPFRTPGVRPTYIPLRKVDLLAMLQETGHFALPSTTNQCNLARADECGR
jgi:hypothetical protein